MPVGDLLFIDSAYPIPAAQYPAGVDGVCGYIGGDTPNVWTAADWAAQPARYRLPVFVQSDPGSADPAADADAALAGLRGISCPAGCLVAWDVETAAGPSYVAGVYAALNAAGYTLIVYGSQSTVMGNANPDGLYWGGDWTGVPHIATGDVMTQFVSFSSYDESEAQAALPFWDTQNPGPAPRPYPAPSDVTAGTVSLAVSWTGVTAPGGAAVLSYTVRAVGLDGKVYATVVTGDGLSAVIPGLVPRWTYDVQVWANGGPVAPPNTTIRVTV